MKGKHLCIYSDPAVRVSLEVHSRTNHLPTESRQQNSSRTQVKPKQWPILLRSLELSFTLFTSYMHLQTGKLHKNLPQADENPGLLEGTNTKLPWRPHRIPHIKISTEDKSTSKIIKYNITSSPEARLSS